MTSPIDAGIDRHDESRDGDAYFTLVLKEPITSKKAGGVLIGAWGSVNHLAILHDKSGTQRFADGQPALFY